MANVNRLCPPAVGRRGLVVADVRHTLAKYSEGALTLGSNRVARGVGAPSRVGAGWLAAYNGALRGAGVPDILAGQ